MGSLYHYIEYINYMHIVLQTLRNGIGVESSIVCYLIGNHYYETLNSMTINSFN